MKTPVTNLESHKSHWWHVNAEGQTLGRLATEIANTIRGKNKPSFTPHLDMGDFVVVTNCEKVVVKGRKSEQKVYYKHTGWFGGLKETSFQDMIAKKPEEVIKAAVKGMLPKNKLASRQIKKLKIYRGSEHPHQAQKAQELKL